MDNASKFIESYNRITSHLRSVIHADSNVTFSQLIHAACERHIIDRGVADRLRDYGDLRNAIVHYRAYPAKIIAEPTTEVVDEFNRDIDSILSPARLIPAFRRDVRLFIPESPLVDVLSYMGSHDYSQAVISLDKDLSLLTAEGIAKWLEAQVVEDIISVREAKVINALRYETSKGFLLMGRDRTVMEAREAFASSLERKQARLFAIIVTQNGTRGEKPLGIVTPWDLID